jgi:adenylate cyclase
MIAGIALTLLASLLYLSNNSTVIEILQRLEAIPYDIRLKLTTPIKANDTPPIVIIDIDEASLKQDGRWPWSRKKIAKLIDKLAENNTAVITMDVVQSEKEENPTVQLRQALSELKETLPDWISTVEGKLDADAYFAHTIKDKEVILGYPFHNKLLSQTGKLPSTFIELDTDKLESLTTINMLGYTANLTEFTNNAAGSGFFSIAPDVDGTVRRAPIIAKYNDQIYPSLALETARHYLLEESINLHTASIGSVQTVTHLSLGKLNIPTDAQGQILIPYLGKQNHFSYLSASDILRKDKSFPELENAIAIIGTSAIGLADLRPTPVQVSFPGVEIQANILHGILHPESIAYIPDWTEGATVLSLVLLGVLMMLIYPLLQPISLVISGITLLLATFGLNLWLWSSQHINLPVIISLLLIMAISSIYVIYDLLKENKDRKRIHDMFGQYVPRGHIDKLIDNPATISTDGEKREMTVLFSDLRNFTSLSEPLSTRELKTFLNQYLTPITKIIFDKQGTIDKYVGDMVMAFWGAPIFDPKHAEQAVESALEMQSTITKMQGKFSQLGIDNVAAGIGIHTGEMNVGDMGSDYRRAYTVLGDAVNLGSRLESLTKYYGVKILVSEDTKQQCPNIVFRYIDYVRVKGKQDAIKIYEPVEYKSKLTPEQAEQLNRYQSAFDLYLLGDWKAAGEYFKRMYKETNEQIYHLYLERINEESGTPPKGWDGIHTHTAK